MGFLEILESYVVIDNSKVQKLRERIFIENPLMSNEDRSRRLIRRIHQLINEALGGIEPAYIKELRRLILHRSVKENTILITYSDIIESIAELNLSLEEIIESIKTWYDLHLRGSDISLIDLIDYIKSVQAFYADAPINDPSLKDGHALESSNDITMAIPGEEAFQKKRHRILIATFSIIVFIIFFTLGDSNISVTTEEEIAELTLVIPKSSLSFVRVQELRRIHTFEYGYFNESIKYHTALASPGIPFYLNYHQVDKVALRQYLRGRNSILAESPYYEGILSVAKEYDIHPLLMFAITGQEQGYVSKENPNHLQIANNPFNVYTSWRKYNTNIEDSTAIAAGTVVTILRKRPAGENPFKWVNTRYAEDKNWARGVEMIFNFLLQYEL